MAIGNNSGREVGGSKAKRTDERTNERQQTQAREKIMGCCKVCVICRVLGC